MNKNSTFKDIIHVTFANVINLASSVLNGFIIPIILGNLGYGYYKIFALYASYESLSHLGFNDGMMLSLSGKKYENLNKYNCRANTLFFIIFQLIFSLIIGLMSIFTDNQFYKILLILLGFNNFVVNLQCYYQKISQSVLRFDEFSILTVIQNTFLIISVGCIWVYCKFNRLRSFNFIPYIIIVISISLFIDLWYLYDYREITFGAHTPLHKMIRVFKNYFISGAFITFGWGISLLMFNLDSQFVVKFFSVKTYGIYAFAYSIFSAGLIILQAASPVLLPHLKRQTTGHILKRYSNNLACVIIVVYLCIIGYFPLNWILYHFIYKYYTSLIYFRLLLPGMVVTCCMNIIISSYYYALKKMKLYFEISVISLVIAFILDSLFYVIFKNAQTLAFSSTISLIIWFLISNGYVSKKYHINWIKNVTYLILMMIIFLSISSINNWVIGLIIYLLIYIMITLVLFKQVMMTLIIRLYNYIDKII